MILRSVVPWLAAAVACVSAQGVARAEEPRSIAVVEYRAGSSAAPNIGATLSRLLTVKTGLAVMAPTAARQEFGERLDAEVKECGDKPSCLARLGRALGVDEVILVGLSELGDVILTMQRIVVADGRVAGTMAETISREAPPTEAELERYLRQILPPNDFVQWGKIEIATNVGAASVTIGGIGRGKTPLAPISVSAPGNYDVSVAKSGYSQFNAQIAVTPNALVIVKPELSALPSDAWYRSWWVLAIAGGVAVAAVGTTVLLLQDGPTDVPVVIDPF